MAQVNQFLPEIDAYYEVTDELRVWMQAKETYEAGDPVTAEFGPSLDFYLKPMVRLENITTFDLDDSKSRLLTFSIGYRYLPTPALRRPIAWSLSSRSTSLCQNSGSCSRSQPRRPRLAEWRLYLALLESLAAQRKARIHSYHLQPYVSAEFFYEGHYSKWADTAIYLGCIFPIGRHVEINSYYEHQNQTGKSPNQQYNQFGWIVNLYFARR